MYPVIPVIRMFTAPPSLSQSYGKCGLVRARFRKYPQFAGIYPRLKFQRFPEIELARGR
jgi:hypothetical protein